MDRWTLNNSSYFNHKKIDNMGLKLRLGKIKTLVFVTVILFFVTIAASQLIHVSNSDHHQYQQNDNELTINISPSCPYDHGDFRRMGHAVERALTFFENNINKLVLDAAIGTRVIEAQLRISLQRHPKLPRKLKEYIEYLIRKSEAVSNDIILAVASKPNISIEEKRHTLPWVTINGLWDWPVDGIWENESTMRTYEPTQGINASKILAQSRETLEESQSDTCIYQVFNCESQETSPICHELFFVREQSLYSLTHQVIYTLFAKKKQCFRAINENQLRRYQERLCGKVWLEANAIAESQFPPQFADLFVEQIGICGMTGYPNFLRRDWLMKVLEWQSQGASGCFVDPRASSAPGQSLALLLQTYQQNKEKFQELIQQRINLRDHLRDPHSQTISRVKRSDMFLKQGNRETCSVHFTAVGITAIGVHMRYFLDTCLSSY